MYRVGQKVMFKYLGQLVKAVVIDVDATFITLHFEYKKGLGMNMKVKANNKDIFKIDSDIKLNTEAFTSQNNFMA